MSTDDQQKRGGLVPIGTVAVRLPGVEGRGRAMSARSRHHFTTLRQVNQLIEASEAEPELGFMARLPFGNIPRLLLAWVCSEAVRTQRRELVLGRSLYEFMHKLGMEDRSGGRHGERARLKNSDGAALYLLGPVDLHRK